MPRKKKSTFKKDHFRSSGDNRAWGPQRKTAHQKKHTKAYRPRVGKGGGKQAVGKSPTILNTLICKKRTPTATQYTNRGGPVNTRRPVIPKASEKEGSKHLNNTRGGESRRYACLESSGSKIAQAIKTPEKHIPGEVICIGGRKARGFHKGKGTINRSNKAAAVGRRGGGKGKGGSSAPSPHCLTVRSLVPPPMVSVAWGSGH